MGSGFPKLEEPLSSKGFGVFGLLRGIPSNGGYEATDRERWSLNLFGGWGFTFAVWGFWSIGLGGVAGGGGFRTLKTLQEFRSSVCGNHSHSRPGEVY